MALNFEAFARLRPLMPVQALIEAAGTAWKAPEPEDEGYVSYEGTDAMLVCSAYLDVENRLHKICFYRNFPGELVLEGVSIGMPVEAALAVRPGMRRIDGDEVEEWAQRNIGVYRETIAAGDVMELRVREGRLLVIELSRPGLARPERPYKYADPRLTRAYNVFPGALTRLPVTGRDTAWHNGWCLGRPPGISTAQWPLGDTYGHPLRHAFTLRVPEDYRTQGSEYVALSLFVDEQFLELKSLGKLPEYASSSGREEIPAGDDLIESSHHHRHPRSYKMSDLLGCEYVVLWLTETEFAGPLASPPEMAEHPWLHGTPEPSWRLGHLAPDWLLRSQPDMASYGAGLARPITIEEREDPNVGKPAREWEHQNQVSGYVPAFSTEGQALELDRFQETPHHLGGTMIPVQGYPPFSPYYFEFGEEFACFNFGGGVGQVDLEQMKIDWACG